jgi:hypothetical protein
MKPFVGPTPPPRPCLRHQVTNKLDLRHYVREATITLIVIVKLKEASAAATTALIKPHLTTDLAIKQTRRRLIGPYFRLNTPYPGVLTWYPCVVSAFQSDQ